MSATAERLHDGDLRDPLQGVAEAVPVADGILVGVERDVATDLTLVIEEIAGEAGPASVEFGDDIGHGVQVEGRCVEFEALVEGREEPLQVPAETNPDHEAVTGMGRLVVSHGGRGRDNLRVLQGRASSMRERFDMLLEQIAGAMQTRQRQLIVATVLLGFAIGVFLAGSMLLMADEYIDEELRGTDGTFQYRGEPFLLFAEPGSECEDVEVTITDRGGGTTYTDFPVERPYFERDCGGGDDDGRWIYLGSMGDCELPGCPSTGEYTLSADTRILLGTESDASVLPRAILAWGCCGLPVLLGAILVFLAPVQVAPASDDDAAGAAAAGSTTASDEAATSRADLPTPVRVQDAD